MRNRNKREDNRQKHLINEKIRFPEVRVVDGIDEKGVYKTNKALSIASNLDKDLVLINKNANPPVCKIVDYSKFLYEEKKKAKELASKQKTTVLKELRLGADIADNDFNVQLRKAEKFLQKGNKVKFTVLFRGRNITFKDKGRLVLLRMAEALEDLGIPEYTPKLEGRKMNITLKPKK